ncbi:MAG: O-antigen ligase family protein [Elusimicrobiota bacterium]|jgi:tetratricopeptide (TPR) repeat protein/O-antigen ligase|nr:O-antigen ligase family protein [Elusimicrobiota bacterium]
MKTKILNFTDIAIKILLIICIFVCPLIFLTDFARNPFNVQGFVLNISLAALLFLWGAKTLLSGGTVFKINKADYFFFTFIFIYILSFVYNMFISPAPAALAAESARRGQILLTNVLAGYLLAKMLLPYEEKIKYKTPASAWLFLWAFAWAFFPVFKMAGLFDVYAILIWCFGIWLCYKILKPFNLQKFVDIFIAVAALAALYGIMQNLGFDIFWKVNISKEFGARAVSTFGNPNFLSSYIVLFLPLAFIFFIKAESLSARFYYFAIIILFSVFLAISMTRSSWLGALAAICVLCLFKDFRELIWRSKKSFLFIFIAAALAFGFWPQRSPAGYSSAAKARVLEAAPLAKGSALTLSAPESKLNQAYHQRLMFWTCGFDMLKKSPLLGKGWGSFQLEYAPCQGNLILKYPALKILKTQANAAHNELVETASQSGLLGLAAYLAFFIAATYLLFKKFNAFSLEQKLFYAALIAGIAAMLVDNMLNITLQTTVLAFAFWFILSAALLPISKTIKLKIKPWLGGVIFVLCLILSFGLAKYSLRVFKSDNYEFKALKLQMQNNLPAAKQGFEISINLANNKADTYYALINLLMKEGNLKEALSVAKEAEKYFPFYYEFYFRQAAIYAAWEQNDKAVLNLAKTLKMFPTYPPAGEFFSMLLAQTPSSQSSDNIKLLYKITQIMPFNPNIKISLATALGQRGDFTAAAKLNAEVLAEDNFNPDAYYGLLFYAEKNQTEQNYALLIKKADELKAIKTQLDTERLPKNIEKKIKEINNRYPNDLSSAMLLAEYYYKTEQALLAYKTLEPFYKIYPYNTSLGFALSSAAQAMGDKKLAANYLEKILNYDSFNKLAAQRLGKLK